MRPLENELSIPNGIYTTNKTANIDPLYGPFLTLDDAMSKVLVTQRVVGKLLAISPGNVALTDLSYVDLYTWTTDVNGNWGAQRVSLVAIPYQIITLGEIVVDFPNSKVTVNLDIIGYNQIRLNGVLYKKNTINEFTIDPIIAPNNYRKDIIEARPNSTLFYLKKGTESPNPVAPNVTSGGMLISEILVTSTGASSGGSNLDFATQAEVENQTAPTFENKKVISLFNLWKWRDALTWLILRPISSTAIAYRLRSNGTDLYYANASALEKKLAYMEDLEINTVTISTPTLTLLPTHKNKNLLFTVNCIVTIPTSLGSGFNCIGASNAGISTGFIVDSGVTVNNDGLSLIPKGVFSLIATGVDNLILRGDLL